MSKRTVKVKLFLLFCSFVGAGSVSMAQEMATPYGEMQKKDFSGSAYTISGKEIRDIPVSNLINMLAGRLPGLLLMQNDGQPGDESTLVNIRGNRANNQGVLVLVDGVQRDFEMIMPQEIESITILKDAAATVLYGSRASNGALLVTTKKGHVGKPTVGLTVQAIFQQPTRPINPTLGSEAYARSYNEARMNDGLDPTYSEGTLQAYARHLDDELYPDVDWVGSLLKKSTWMQRYNVTIDGGSERTRYFVSLGATLQEGQFNADKDLGYSTNTEFNRYNFRSNIEFDLTKTTLVSAGIDGSMVDRNMPAAGMAFGVGNLTPYFYEKLQRIPANSFPMYYKDTHNYVDQNGFPLNPMIGDKIPALNDAKDIQNPWVLLNRSGYAAFNSRYGAFKLAVDQDLEFITPGLSIHGLLSMDTSSDQYTQRDRGFNTYQLMVNADGDKYMRKYGTSEEMMNNKTIATNSIRNTTLNFNLRYNRTFGAHRVGALVGYDQYERATDIDYPSRYQGLSGWFTYNYDNRYQADITMGYQGSYKLKGDNRWAFNPSVALAWNVSNEKFFQPLTPIFSYLKIRGSVGKLTNDRALGQFDYASRMLNLGGVAFFGEQMNGVQGYWEIQVANPSATYEKVIQSNLGIDMGFFDQRLSLSLDLWKDHRTKMYVAPSSFSYLLGYTAYPLQNLGEMKSKGLDASARWTDKIGEVSYFVGGNLSVNRNEIIDVDETPQEYAYRELKGHSIGVQRGLIAEGFFGSWEEIAAAPEHTFSSVAPGDIRYKDVNGDGKIDAQDNVPFDWASLPALHYGVDLGFSYKGISVSALFQGVAQTQRYLSGHVAFAFNGQGSLTDYHTDRWTPEHQNAAFPKYTTGLAEGNNNKNSTFWLRDASFLRLKNVQVSYSLPDTWMKKIRMQEVRIFVSGQNLCLWDHMKYVDPEGSTNAQAFPIQRAFSAGINLNF